MPKVSVLVPLYNTDENHLKEMIESVLSQSFTDFELLLLNDSPENQSLKTIVGAYDDERIFYTENPKNLGISESRNKLLAMAKGEYLAIFDHDDVCMPTRLEKQVKYMDQHPEVGVCSSLTYEMPSGRKCYFPEENEEIKSKLMTDCCVVHSAAMLRKTVLVENRISYEAAYSPAEDYMLWIRLMGITMFHNIQEPLIKYRKYVENTSHRKKEEMLDKDALIKCIALRDYPYYLVDNKKKIWIYLFDFIPIIKVKRIADKKIYSLFGVIPILSTRD